MGWSRSERNSTGRSMRNSEKERATRIFLDSNVILSGLISNRGAPRKILDLLCLNYHFLSGVTGQYNLTEIERNLMAKLPRAIPVYKDYLPRLQLEVIPLPSPDDISRFTAIIANKDAPVLASANHANIDYLVTGDKKDFGGITEKHNLPFVTASPTKFIDEILPGCLRSL